MPKNQEIEEKDDKIIENEKISKEVVATEKPKVTGKSKTEDAKKVNKKEKEIVEKVEETEKIKTEKAEKVNSKNQVDEATIIEKIKSFIAKIAAMQEEARKEAQEKIEENAEQDEKAKVKPSKKLDKEEKETKKVEYYDLPYRYNETVVKILAQTPKRMFVYWDISDNDRQKYVDTFGENFFDKTYPVLLVYNEDKKYVKEVPINDFANSWYIEIDDPKTKYTIQLGRKFKIYNEAINVDMQKVQENNIILHVDYLPFANSNMLEAPNDHVLFETLPRFITFRNVKTNQETTKDLRSFKDVFGKVFDIKDFYEEHYKEELSEGMFDMANPSSSLSSSKFK